MKNLIIIYLLLISSVSLGQEYFLNGTKLLTQNFIDRNPAFGSKSHLTYPYNDYEFLVFERHSLTGTANICAIKMKSYGSFDTVTNITSGNNICRNPAVDYYKDFSFSQKYAFVVWEQYINGRWNLYGRSFNQNTGWRNIFPVDTTSYDKFFPSVSRVRADTIYAVAYERNNDIIYKEFNINTGAQLYEINLTSSDTAACKNPVLTVANVWGSGEKLVAFERQKPNLQFAIYKIKADYNNVWTSADTVSKSGNNRNPSIASHFYIVFESDRNGKWNNYVAEVFNYNITSVYPMYGTTNYNCRNLATFFYPVITDMYATITTYVREGNDSVKIMSGSGFVNPSISDSITIGDTSKKPVLSIGKGIGTMKGYSTVWIVYNKDSAGFSKLYGKYHVILLDNIKKTGNEIPDNFSLEQNFPNPFNQLSIIQFKVASSKFIKLVVYDILAKEVKTIVNEYMQPGTYNVSFDGNGLSSGIYFYKMTAGDFSATKKFVLIK